MREKPRYFEVGGPFVVPVEGPTGYRVLATAERRAVFWRDTAPDWADRIGCYVYGLRTSQGTIHPVYVGKTARTFRAECFHSEKFEKLAHATRGQRGRLVLFFVGRDRRRSNESTGEIRKLERYLIRHAVMKLDEAGRLDLLANNHHVELKNRFAIQGVHRNPNGRSRVSASSRELQRSLGIRGIDAAKC